MNSSTICQQDLDALVTAAKAWMADDPDVSSRDELAALLDKLPDDAIIDDLADRFSGPLTFGTAGLRGPLRAGPNGMNRAVVCRAAAGLASYLNSVGATGPVVIGYDARYGSKQFAYDTAEIVVGSGRAAKVMPRELPTPLLAFAVGHFEAAAGVMVTASHNPPQDNGYKVYLGGDEGRNAQIVPPADAEISDAIASVGKVADIPRGNDFEVVGDAIVRAYLSRAASVLDPSTTREVTAVSTALHGVGGPLLGAAFEAAGFTAPTPVDAQQAPNPDFPGLAFPNPEEKNVMDDVVDLAHRNSADIAIANDPDADRCAIAAPMRDGWRALRGDELGVLLADHLIRRGEKGTYATTIVSSSLLGVLCKARGVPYAETLTGFKWIVRGPDSTGVPLRFGYEEAIGYCVDPSSVNDKDGITAALVAAELVGVLKSTGQTLQDRLDEIYTEFGHYKTDQISVRVEDVTIISDTMQRLRDNLPTKLGDWDVTTEDVLPQTDALIVRGDGVRVVIRPSGTEPKLKAYLETVVPPTGDTTADAAKATAQMSALRASVESLVN